MQNNITSPVTIQPNNYDVIANKIVFAYLAQMANAQARRVQKHALDKMSQIISSGKVRDSLAFPWHLLRYEHTQIVRAKLLDTYKPATINRFLSALRCVLRAAWRMGYMSADEYQRAADVKDVRHVTLPAGREITQAELKRMFSTCRTDLRPSGVRDTAIFAVLYGCGLRRAEITGLNLADVDFTEGRVLVHGKGKKERYTYLPSGTVSALMAWLSLRGDNAGALFTGIRKGIINTHLKNMTGQAIYVILEKRAAESGVTDISPHDLRRTFVSNLLDNGNDLSVVSKMAGHSNIQTTARYDRRLDDTKKRAANTLQIPQEEKENDTCL